MKLIKSNRPQKISKNSNPSFKLNFETKSLESVIPAIKKTLDYADENNRDLSWLYAYIKISLDKHQENKENLLG